MVTPLVTQQIDDLTVAENSAEATFDLSETFDDPSTTGQVAQFKFSDSTGVGTADVLLFDQTGVGAPATVANFINYAEDGDYNGTIIHRSIPGFIVQGGGFVPNETNPNSAPTEIPTDEPVVNEFNIERSNIGGTISMAKQGGDPDSATNQWFFNLADNSENLDNQNGGFTAFGELLTEADRETIDAIAALPISNFGGAFTDLPLNNVSTIDSVDDFVVLDTISLLNQDELEFSVVDNSNPELVDVAITDGELSLDYLADRSGEATVTLQATNLLGESVEEEFVITVEDTETPEAETPDVETPNVETPDVETPDVETPDVETPDVETPNVETPDAETPDVETPDAETPDVETPDAQTPDAVISGLTIYRFLNTSTGVHLYTSDETERESIEEDSNFVPEGVSFSGVDPTSNSEADEVYRFINTNTDTYFYTTDEVERDSILENLDNYVLEEDNSFFAFEEEQAGTIPIYRFYETSTGTHFYTGSEVERDSIIDNLPNYVSEDIAYFAFPVAE